MTISTKIQTNASRLGLSHFLERRKAFLDSIGSSATFDKAQSTSKAAQDNLISILQKAKLSADNYKSSSAIIEPDHYGPNSEARTARDITTIRQMLACGVHFGHATSRWNPKMAPFIYGERAGIHIINLERTLLCIRQACNVTKNVATMGGTILFVGTSAAWQRLTYECAQDAGQYYVNTRWVGGTITNRTQVLRNDRLQPDLLIVLDSVHNKSAIEEARTSGIPTIAICDTNCDPTAITYPIPANDDAYASVELIARTLSAAAAEGRKIRTKQPLPSHEIFESANTFIERVFETFSMPH